MRGDDSVMSASNLRDRWPLVDRRELVERGCARLADSGVVITGFAGLGKTALSRLIESRLMDDGWSVVRVTATLAGRAVPYSALASVVDAEPDSGVAHDGVVRPPTPERVATALRRRAEHDRAALVVDDAQWLDAGSAALLHTLVDRDDVRILATVRTGEPGAEEWEALADDGVVHRLALDAADRSLISSILETALGGRPAPGLVDELVERSAGNLLFLRELVLTAVESGTIAPVGQTWQLVGPLATSDDGLGRTIARRIRSLDDTASAALASIAIIEPVPFDLLVHLPLADQLAGLERRGFVVTEADGTVRIAHPLLGEGARATLTGSEFRLRLDEATQDVLAKLEAHDSDLALRLVAQRVAHDLFVPIDWLRTTAGRAFALLDHELAVRLGRRALESDARDVESNLVVGAGLSAQFLTAEAEPHLRSALQAARTDSQRARAAGRLGLHLGTRLGRRDEAIELMEAELDQLAEPAWRQFLAADLGKIELLAGRSGAASMPSRPDPDQDPVAVLNQAIMTALISSLAGDVDTTEAQVSLGLPLTPTHTAALPNGRDLLRLAEFVARLVSGNTVEAESLAAQELDACRSGRDEPLGLWQAMLATAALASGHPALAENRARQALPLVAARDFVGGLHPSTQALRAVALAQLGRFGDASAQLDEIDDVWASDPRTSASVAQAEAWIAVLNRGEQVGGRLAEAASAVAAAGMLSVALPIAHDAVRLGQAGAVVDLLESFALSAPRTVAGLFHRHATAAASGDAPGLVAVAGEFDQRSMPILAAEARLQAAAVSDDAARQRWLTAEARAQMRTAGLDRSPFLDLGGSDDAAITLTERQLQVARMASARLRSKEIASQIGLSVRTVDNVLGQVYQALGVSSRDELRAVLGDGVVERAATDE
jgi:DNA-binding CsgD family transcriptional regulator